MKVKHVRFTWDEGLHTMVKRAALDRGLSMAAFVEAAVLAMARPPQQATPAPKPPAPRAAKVEPMEPKPESMVDFARSFPKPTKAKR